MAAMPNSRESQKSDRVNGGESAKVGKKGFCVIIYSYNGNVPRRTRLINQFPPPGGL